mgnify:CR=1 FL=1
MSRNREAATTYRGARRTGTPSSAVAASRISAARHGGASARTLAAAEQQLLLQQAQQHRIPPAALLQALLEFQLSGHLADLAPFVAKFRQHDVAGRGLLDEAGFRALLAELGPIPEEQTICAMLERVDPHLHQRITFSDCVCVLADEIERLQQR